MDLKAAAKQASVFLESFLEEHAWFTAPDQVVPDYRKREASLTNVLMVFGARAKADGIKVVFVHGRDVDPKASNCEARIAECITALRAAHPELEGIAISHSLIRE